MVFESSCAFALDDIFVSTEVQVLKFFTPHKLNGRACSLTRLSFVPEDLHCIDFPSLILIVGLYFFRKPIIFPLGILTKCYKFELGYNTTPELCVRRHSDLHREVTPRSVRLRNTWSSWISHPSVLPLFLGSQSEAWDQTRYHFSWLEYLCGQNSSTRASYEASGYFFRLLRAPFELKWTKSRDQSS